MRGWFAIVVCIVVFAIFTSIVYHPQDRSEKIEKTMAQTETDLRRYSDAFFNLSENQMMRRNSKNPLFHRQNYYLKKYLLQCSWVKMNTANPQKKNSYRKMILGSQADQKQIFLISRPYQQKCSEELLDSVMEDGEFSLLLAQAIKFTGVSVGEEYNDLPDEWPDAFLRSYNSKKLHRVIGR